MPQYMCPCLCCTLAIARCLTALCRFPEAPQHSRPVSKSFIIPMPLYLNFWTATAVDNGRREQGFPKPSKDSPTQYNGQHSLMSKDWTSSSRASNDRSVWSLLSLLLLHELQSSAVVCGARPSSRRPNLPTQAESLRWASVDSKQVESECIGREEGKSMPQPAPAYASFLNCLAAFRAWFMLPPISSKCWVLSAKASSLTSSRMKCPM